MQISLTLFLSAALVCSGMTCRSYTCEGAETLPGSVCMAYNETTDVFVLSPCDTTVTTCPNPAFWGDQFNVTCEEWNSRKTFSCDSFEDYHDAHLVTTEGAECDLQGLMSLCDYNSGLVCHCPENNCTCVAGIQLGGNCSETTAPCVPGHVCNNGVCVLMYSLLAGDSASDERACRGGGPLITNYFSSTCRQTSQTIGGIPRVCISDKDCAGSDNTYTKCVCGLNSERQAYCRLHFNDEPMEQFRNSFNNYLYKDSVYWYFVQLNYPYFQGTVPECLRNVWRDFGEYKRDLSFSIHRILPAAVLLLIG